MAMFAIATIPLIHQLASETMKQIWYADDTSVGGTAANLHKWWDKLMDIGPSFGYYSNASKSWLLVKENHLAEAVNSFDGTNVSITTEGRCVLGSPIGTESFMEDFVVNKIKMWSSEIATLSNIALSQPQAAYAAYIHGVTSRWLYLSRTCPDTSKARLEQVIRFNLIPSLTGKIALNDLERNMLALPIRHGGLGIVDPSLISSSSYQASIAVSSPITNLILDQCQQIPYEASVQQSEMKSEIRKKHNQEASVAKDEIYHNLPLSSQKLMDISCEKGASSWLPVIPLEEHGFVLHKGAFRDALCLRYGWRPNLLPNNCVCGNSFTCTTITMGIHKASIIIIRWIICLRDKKYQHQLLLN